MSKHEILQVDAFTDRPLGGNPCAVVFEADGIDEATMQAIAVEMNLSETAFVLRSQRADFRARYFTPSGEIPMAGHPTVATIFALAETGRLPLAGERVQVFLELPAGLIPIEIRARDGRAESIVMTQLRPDFLRRYEAAEVLPAFGLEPDDALPGAPIETVSTGTPQLMIPLRAHDALRRCRMRLDLFESLVRGGDFFSCHLFCLAGATSEGDTFSRHFGPPPRPFEDPFTGSATGGMAAYLWHHGLLERPRFTAEQGHWMERPGRADVEVLGPRENIEGVRVGGKAVVVLTGELIL